MIVDWADNCEKIFLTKQITMNDPSDSKSKYKQEIIFLKYLRNVLQFNQDDCFAEWSRLTNGTAAGLKSQGASMKDAFSKIYTQSTKKFNKVNYKTKLSPIIIFQSEIEYLNSLPVPAWVREYWACLLFYYKFESQNTNHVQKSTTLNSWCIRQTSHKDKRYGSVCQDMIAKYKIATGEKVILDFPKVGKDHYSSYKPDFIATEGFPLQVFTSITEVGKFLELITPPVQKCKMCGKEFDMTVKLKREYCEDCYVIYRRQYKTLNKRKEREKKKMSTGKMSLLMYDKGENNIE